MFYHYKLYYCRLDYDIQHVCGNGSFFTRPQTIENFGEHVY